MTLTMISGHCIDRRVATRTCFYRFYFKRCISWNLSADKLTAECFCCAVHAVCVEQRGGVVVFWRWAEHHSDDSRQRSRRVRCVSVHSVSVLIHDLLFRPICTIESAVGKRLITHCCISCLACSRLSGHVVPHSPDFKREINTTTTVMN